MYGMKMKMNSGTISNAPVTYPTHNEGFTPEMLNSQTARITNTAISCARPKSANPRLKYTVLAEPGNHSATMRAPTMFPTKDRTTDHPIQYPNAAMGPKRLNRLRHPS